jgi:hypothetical protein
MPTYVLSLEYGTGSNRETVEYESTNPTLKQARADAREMAKKSRVKDRIPCRVLRVESRAASDRRRQREFGI